MNDASTTRADQPLKVAALYRVSTLKQQEHGTGLQAQRAAYRELAAKNGWETVEEFEGSESAVQAASDRLVLQRLLRCLAEYPVDAVWVIEQSRLTRGDELEVALLQRELRERGVKVIVGTTFRDLNSIDESFMFGIQGLVDRAESQRIKQRMQRGKRQRAAAGMKSGGPSPYGYENPPPGSANRGKLQVVPDEARVVKRIFEAAAAGKGDVAIANGLNESGIPAPRGGLWGKSTVRRILKCPAYLGTSVARAWVAEGGKRSFKFRVENPNAIVVRDAHKPIVDRELWDAARNRPKNLATRTPRMLTGLLNVDNRPFAGDSSRGVAFYRGPRGLPGLPWLDAEATDEAVWDAFTRLATDPALVEQLLAAARNPKDQELAAQECDYLEAELGKSRRRLDRLVTMRVDGEIDKATFAARKTEIEDSIKRMEDELAVQRSKAVNQDATQAARVVEAVRSVLGGKRRLTPAQKRAVLASIVKRIDATVAPTGAGLPRDEKGRVVAGHNARWAVTSVSLRLALPEAGGVEERGTGERGATGGPTDVVEAHAGVEAAESRRGQAGTTFFGCGQVSAADGVPGAFRRGQAGTTLFSCAQVSGTVGRGGRETDTVSITVEVGNYSETGTPQCSGDGWGLKSASR